MLEDRPFLEQTLEAHQINMETAQNELIDYEDFLDRVQHSRARYRRRETARSYSTRKYPWNKYHNNAYELSPLERQKLPYTRSRRYPDPDAQAYAERDYYSPNSGVEIPAYRRTYTPGGRVTRNYPNYKGYDGDGDLY